MWKRHGVYQAYINDLNLRYSRPDFLCVKPTVLPENLYPDVWIADSAINEISNLPFNRPWFLWVSFIGPHEPFDVPTRWRRYRDIPDPVSRPKEKSQVHKFAPPGSILEKKILNSPRYQKELVDEARQDYTNHLELLDCQVKRIINRLNFRADFCNTSIAMCSDHGELLGDWGCLLKVASGRCNTLFVYSQTSRWNKYFS